MIVARWLSAARALTTRSLRNVPVVNATVGEGGEASFVDEYFAAVVARAELCLPAVDAKLG